MINRIIWNWKRYNIYVKIIMIVLYNLFGLGFVATTILTNDLPFYVACVCLGILLVWRISKVFSKNQRYSFLDSTRRSYPGVTICSILFIAIASLSVYAAAPVMQEVSVDPNHFYNKTSLRFACNATDADNDPLMYYWNFSMNGTLIESGNYYFSGYEYGNNITEHHILEYNENATGETITNYSGGPKNVTLFSVIYNTYFIENYTYLDDTEDSYSCHTGCGGFDASHPLSNFFDEDNTTYASHSAGYGIYWNYTLHDNIVRTKYHLQGDLSSANNYCYNGTQYISLENKSLDNPQSFASINNFTIPSSCLDNGDNVLRMYMTGVGGSITEEWLNITINRTIYNSENKYSCDTGCGMFENNYPLSNFYDENSATYANTSVGYGIYWNYSIPKNSSIGKLFLRGAISVSNNYCYNGTQFIYLEDKSLSANQSATSINTFTIPLSCFNNGDNILQMHMTGVGAVLSEDWITLKIRNVTEENENEEFGNRALYVAADDGLSTAYGINFSSGSNFSQYMYLDINETWSYGFISKCNGSTLTYVALYTGDSTTISWYNGSDFSQCTTDACNAIAPKIKTGDWVRINQVFNGTHINLYLNSVYIGNVSASCFNSVGINKIGRIYDNIKIEDFYYPQGHQIELYEIPLSNVSNDTSYKFSCKASDGTTNSSWMSETFSIISIMLGNCTNTSWYEIMTFYGRDESDDSVINDMRLNIDFSAVVPSANETLTYSAAFDNESNYSICTFPQFDVIASAVMEYGDGAYTDKKYHIVNASITAGDPSEIYLYHLNDSLASEVVYYVYEVGTNQPISGSYIKVQRYYPAESAYKTVEIEKTDDTGYALGKMILSDVFYRYVIEQPAGTSRLRTDVNKVLSLTRNFPISLADDVMQDWYDVQGVSVSTSCTKLTDTCRFEWSDSSNVVQSGKLEVYRDTGTSKVKIYEETISSPSASIIYEINESTDGKNYEAVGYVESSSGNVKTGTAALMYAETLGSNTREKIEFVLPLVLGTAFLMTMLLDYGVTGIIIGSLTGITIGGLTFIIPLKYTTIISLLILGGILIFKVRGRT